MKLNLRRRHYAGAGRASSAGHVATLGTSELVQVPHGVLYTYPHSAGVLGILAIDDALTVEVCGRHPALHRLPIKPLGHRWANPHRFHGVDAPVIGFRMDRVIRL